MTVQAIIRFANAEEKRKTEKLAKAAKLTFNNYVRQRLDLPPLSHGGARRRPVKSKPKPKPQPQPKKSKESQSNPSKENQ